jgi:hypothetical protein
MEEFSIALAFVTAVSTKGLALLPTLLHYEAAF